MSNPITMPARIVRIRKDMCLRSGCSEAHEFSDPCARCAKSGWGSHTIDCAQTLPPFADPAGALPALSTSEWPLALQPLKLLARPNDRGLGDIVSRVIGPIGGEAFKAWYLKTFGQSCGCDARQELWNSRYPLRRANGFPA